MSTRNLLNLVLLVFIGLLIMLVVYEPGQTKATAPPALTDLKENEVQHIAITRKNGTHTIELIKNNGNWKMLQPYQQAANTFRIDAILKLLSAVSFSQNNLANLNPAEFGLNEPVATITFNKKTRIIFGNNKSLNHHRYVQVGSVLHMIGDIFYYKLAANAESFIDHKLLPDKSKITQIVLPQLTLSQSEGKWVSTDKENNYSADSINQLIDEWQLSQAYDVKIKKTSKDSKADIKIKFKNHAAMNFIIEKEKNSFSLTNINNGVNYILSTDRKNKLLKLSPLEDN